MNPGYLSKIQSTVVIVVAAMAMSALTACGGGKTTAPPLQSNTTGVAVSPSNAAVRPSAAQQFTATVFPSGTNQAVTWSVSGPGCSGASCGAIDATGKYTAPATLPNPPTVMVSATSVADSTMAAASTVTLFTTGGAFTPIGNMTVARADHSATLLPDGRVLIAGGVSNAGTPLASAELYDPSTHSFTPTGSMTVPRNSPRAVLLANGKVLIVGGSQDLSAEIYDPSTGAFTSGGNMVSAGTPLNALDSRLPTLLQDGRVLVEGVNAEIYDPATGVFSLTAAYADANALWFTSTLLQDGRVLLTGCVQSCGGGATELYDPQTNTFNFANLLTQWEDVNTATLLTNGKVLFVGNEENDGFSADAALYDPAAGIFASIGNTIAPHEFAASVRLADGTVLISGGQLPMGDASPNSDLYLPATGTFASADNMTVGRYEHTATLLHDGTVLITGGNSSSAEIYDPNKP